MILTALLLLAAQTSEPSTAAAPAGKPAPDPDQVICRRETATGSNMSRKVCHTRAQWKQLSGANEGAAERMRGGNPLRPDAS